MIRTILFLFIDCKPFNLKYQKKTTNDLQGNG